MRAYLSGDASFETSFEMIWHGLMFANSPSSLRMRRSPCSGPTGEFAHFGPPMAPISTASACSARQRRRRRDRLGHRHARRTRKQEAVVDVDG